MKNILDKCLLYIENTPKDIKEKIKKRILKKILKKLDKLYFSIEYMEKLIVALYGLDSQVLLDFKDKLNKYSIDWDREDTK